MWNSHKNWLNIFQFDWHFFVRVEWMNGQKVKEEEIVETISLWKRDFFFVRISCLLFAYSDKKKYDKELVHIQRVKKRIEKLTIHFYLYTFWLLFGVCCFLHHTRAHFFFLFLFSERHRWRSKIHHIQRHIIHWNAGRRRRSKSEERRMK